jgi:hypothetical protein
MRARGAAGRPDRNWRGASSYELELVWQAELPIGHRRALDGALAREPGLRAQLAPLLCSLDGEPRETFVRALARAFASRRPPEPIADAVKGALERTRVAAFWLELASDCSRRELEDGKS